MENKRLNHKISFVIDEEVLKKLESFNFEPRSIFLCGLSFLELQIGEGYTPTEISLPRSKMRKLNFILEAKDGNI